MNINKFYSEVLDSYSYNKIDEYNECDKNYCFFKFFENIMGFNYDEFEYFLNKDYDQINKYLEKHGKKIDTACVERMAFIMKKLNIPIEKMTHFLSFTSFRSSCCICFRYKDKAALNEFMKYLKNNSEPMEIE